MAGAIKGGLEPYGSDTFWVLFGVKKHPAAGTVDKNIYTFKKPSEIYYLSSADFYYQKLDRSKWVGTKDANGRIVIKFTPVLQTSNLKIHCNYDDLDYLQQVVDKSEFYNSPEKLVTVYQKQYTRTESYGYDGMGNRLTESISLRKERIYQYEYYANCNRLKTSKNGQYAYNYDKNGNMTEKGNKYTWDDINQQFSFEHSGDGVEYWHYSYDLLNQLVQVQKNGQVVASYIYDPTGFRVEKVGSKGKIDYVPLLNGEVGYRKEFSSSKEYSFIYVGGTHLARVNGVIGGSGKKFFYHNDHEGSAMVVTDELGNKVVDRDFAPFGEKIKTSDREDPYPDETEDGFTGKDFDDDIGLYYYNARWYDQEVGRFISEDSVADDPNGYGYCGENPVNNIDPTGHFSVGLQQGLGMVGAMLNAAALLSKDPNLGNLSSAFSLFVTIKTWKKNVDEAAYKAGLAGIRRAIESGQVESTQDYEQEAEAAKTNKNSTTQTQNSEVAQPSQTQESSKSTEETVKKIEPTPPVETPDTPFIPSLGVDETEALSYWEAQEEALRFLYITYIIPTKIKVLSNVWGDRVSVTCENGKPSTSKHRGWDFLMI